MNKIDYSKKFKKQFNKLDKKIQNKVHGRVAIFLLNEFEEILNNHKLRPFHEGQRSINITGDFRLIYEKVGEDSFLFVAIGTHSELYEY